MAKVPLDMKWIIKHCSSINNCRYLCDHAASVLIVGIMIWRCDPTQFTIHKWQTDPVQLSLALIVFIKRNIGPVLKVGMGRSRISSCLTARYIPF